MGVLSEAGDLVNNGDIKILGQSDKDYKLIVKDYLVVFRRLPGRMTVSCECESHSRYDYGLCKHKCAAITFATMRRLI